MKIERYTTYTYTETAGIISDAGIALIRSFLYAQDVSTGEWNDLNPSLILTRIPSLPDGWEWLWIVQKGDYRGTLPKRLSAYYFKQHEIKSPASFLEKVGAIARPHVSNNIVYTFQFVGEFDWQPGEFGDSSSCYFGDRAGALEMIRENGGMAICFYDENEDGLARAWLYEVEECVYIPWNGYGMETIHIARIFAGWTGLSYKRIALTNGFTAYGILWINGARGFVIGAPDKVAEFISYNFNWEEINVYICHYCGKTLNEDEMYVGADDEQYCSRCFHDIFAYCDSCDETTYRDNLTYTDDNQDVCESCLDSNYTRCENCGTYVRNEDAHFHDGDHLCEDCLPPDLDPAPESDPPAP